MKVSRYNRFCVADDSNVIAFNALTGALATLTQNMYGVAEKLLAAPDAFVAADEEEEELKAHLIKGGFLINDTLDELNFIKVRSRMERFQSVSAGITIALTSKCNFRCPYCFEDVENGVTVNEEIEEGIAQFILKKVDSGLRKLHIVWFGGEPLLTLKNIERMSPRFKQHCEDKGCDYSSSIITNGWLLTPAIAGRLKAAHVSTIQITIDGPADVHDRRRMLAGGKGTFYKIIENIKDTYHILPIGIRVNVDSGNGVRTQELLDYFVGEGLHRKIAVYFAPVEEYTETYKDTCGSCMHMSDFAHLEVDLRRKMVELGFVNPPRSPKPRFSFCTADKSNSVVIGPNGDLYACYTHIGDPREVIGSVFTGAAMNQNALKWLGWDPLEKTECSQCEVLPLCGGGCLVEGFKEDLTKKGACETYKFSLDEHLKLFYDTRKATEASQPQESTATQAATGGKSALIGNLKEESREKPTADAKRPADKPLVQIKSRKQSAFEKGTSGAPLVFGLSRDGLG